jgi:predicted XRE-type DNA-binding protein
MKLRPERANQIIERMHARKLTQAKTTALIGVTQPRISDSMRGRLNLFTLDALVDMADRVGPRIAEPIPVNFQLTTRRVHYLSHQ